MIPPFQLLRTSQLPFNYSRNTVRQFRGYHSCDFADAFYNSDCADALKQIRRYSLRIPWIPLYDSVEILWQFRRSAENSCGKSVDIVKFLVTCTIGAIAGELVAYVDSRHLVRLVLCCPKHLLLPLPILITSIPAEFWVCVCAKPVR